MYECVCVYLCDQFSTGAAASSVFLCCMMTTILTTTKYVSGQRTGSVAAAVTFALSLLWRCFRTAMTAAVQRSNPAVRMHALDAISSLCVRVCMCENRASVSFFVSLPAAFCLPVFCVCTFFAPFSPSFRPNFTSSR